MNTLRRFPIMDDPRWTIPWDLIAPHEAQAQRNHSQSLERLAERGGLSSCEAMAVIENRLYYSLSKREQDVERRRLTEAADAWIDHHVNMLQLSIDNLKAARDAK